MEWIRVEDRLPRYKDRVLLCIRPNKVMSGYRIRTDEKGDHFTESLNLIPDYYMSSEVTHWAHLPDPPK